MTNILSLIMILTLISCSNGNKLPDKFKVGLFDFKVKKSVISEQIEDDKPIGYGSLWVGFNKINAKKFNDTLILEINVNLSMSLNYDGGFEVARDTLFLYAKQLDKINSKDTIHSTLTYKIRSKGLMYKEIEFKK